MFFYLFGFIAAGLTVLVFRKRGVEREFRLFAAALIMAALIYVGFGIRAESVWWLLVEVGGLAAYGGMALLALRYHSWGLLAAGWLAHVLWDVGLHFGPEAGFVPGWYVALCLTYDVGLALYLALRGRALRQAATASS